MFWTNAAIDTLLFIFVIICLLMCLVVMMQRSKQEGLGAAFGGGFTESVWGAQTSQVLVKATVWLAALFFIISIGLAHLYSYRATLEKQVSSVQQALLQPVPSGKTAVPSPAKAVPPGQAVVPTATAMRPSPGIPAPTNSAPSQPTK